jgi:hypothetical protein
MRTEDRALLDQLMLPAQLSPELVLVCPELRTAYEKGLLPSVATPRVTQRPVPVLTGREPLVRRQARSLLARAPSYSATALTLLVLALCLALVAAAAGASSPTEHRSTNRLQRVRALDTNAADTRAAAAEAAMPATRRRSGQTLRGRETIRASRQAQLASPEVRAEVEPTTDLEPRLPDPTPPALRLKPSMARELIRRAGKTRVDWARLLAVVRLRNHGRTNVRPRELGALARALARDGSRPDRLSSLTHADDETFVALSRYNRSVGVDSLVSGLRSAKGILAARVLRDPRLSISVRGRSDIARGRVDVRVLAVLLYLAEAEGQVTVSSLVSGHPVSPAGVHTAHGLGIAVDVRAIGGTPVENHQQPGGPVERAVRALLRLPREVQPTQIVSLLDVGGPSLALADDWDHVHVGFDATSSDPGLARLGVLWRVAGATYGVPWSVLAAINEIESNYGSNLGPSSAGAVGWMQFLPSTWQLYGVDADGNGIADPASPADAIFSAARYLAAAGASTDLRRAIFAYNHADWYVNEVLGRAARIQSS